MSQPTQRAVQNILLKALRPEDFDALSAHMEWVKLSLREVVVEADEPNPFVYFIEDGLASVVARSSDGETCEVGHVGREGMTGYHVLLLTRTTTHRTFMQATGAGFRVAVQPFLGVVNNHSQMHSLFLRYIHSCEVQLGHSALANARYSMYARLARWLLMCHDRIDGDNLPLTHEFLSLMLGVRRSGVTDQLHILEGLHAIKATRGNVRIIDRRKLEEVAGGCYGAAEAEYRRLIEEPVEDFDLS
ncbi:CRP-like cAMP-binding protein [Pararhizobium capsulatum DSM 1112]|uniref:CRP-like cAMP-binding protein n=1 Tax=Pararhizobium capsulatum DSM 1112 TaxID=1121113 RepID=A0ABU0BWZ6_9HYPH|nr:Crp/Fnr family transcriptional regulator [Pararhizobium capsulatum]MDQ0322209.1 CRP-like cAMP-binding protein [Pararhizobium capsulatum DSM 1112]